jgi:hypothetical protein
MEQSIAPQGTRSKGKGTETVQVKGLRLFRGGKVRRLHGDVYAVTGDHGTYTVDAHHQKCSCPATVYCSHAVAVEIATAKLNAQTARQLALLRAPKPKRPKATPGQVMAAIERMQEVS